MIHLKSIITLDIDSIEGEIVELDVSGTTLEVLKNNKRTLILYDDYSIIWTDLEHEEVDSLLRIESGLTEDMIESFFVEPEERELMKWEENEDMKMRESK